MNIAEAARASRLTPDTIRYYERRGIVPAPTRLANGYRHYMDTHVTSLRFASGLRDLGLALAGIASLVRLAHDATCRELRSAMISSVEGTLEEIDSRLRALQQTKRELRTLRSGLADMTPRQVKIPGVIPCGCVELLDTKLP
jgi:DNA-binding transcriptional MerR regulator